MNSKHRPPPPAVSNAAKSQSTPPMSALPPGYNGPPAGHPEFARCMQEYKSGAHGGPQQRKASEVRQLSGGYDGPGEPSNGPPGSPAKPQNPFAPGLGYDPARSVVKKSVITNTRVELPSAAYALDNEYNSEIMARPGYGTQGRDVQVRVNQYKVTQWPTKDVYQFDVNIGNGAEKMGLIKAVWESKAVQNRLSGLINGPWLWDGNKIAWCGFPVSEQRILVDLDLERGRTPRPGFPPNTCMFVLRPVKSIRMAILGAYLNKQVPFDNSLLESINFLDHLMRQWPSGQYTMIKRSFFSRGEHTYTLDNYLAAMKGVYSSIRLCSPKPSLGGAGTGLAINVDVANGTFWTSQDLHQAARNFCSFISNNKNLQWPIFRDSLCPNRDAKTAKVSQSDAFRHLQKMAKLNFWVKHRGKQESSKVYKILNFTTKDVREGSNAKNTTFEIKAKNGNPAEIISVYTYYKRTYGIDLQFWYLPLIKTARDGMFPMELCVLVNNQRYQYKLGPEQTAAMIKFAVTRPKERIESINHGIGMLKWHQDPYLAHFGVKIDTEMTVTKAKVLAPPEVQYDKSKATPGYSGRWDLRGKKFLLPNSEPLNSWGVGVVENCIGEVDVRNFLNMFIQTYIGHGGRVQNKNPTIYMGKRGEKFEEFVAATRKLAGDQVTMIPQILLYVLPGRDSWLYERLKKNNECRFATVSQMLNIAHVRTATPQYCSNVSMKVNAKLGGTTCKVLATKPFFTKPTMIIGADVSHPSPLSPMPSTAAITMSYDANAARYAAAVQTNGFRVEMITETNINHMILPLFNIWTKKVNGGNPPHHIYYFRDGVSEGQFSKVINEEVAHMKKAIATVFPTATIRWTVIVCTKRHHIRILPKANDSSAGDRNGNPLPGTLVEHDVTHPFEYDFYLNSHSAIQGTARPVHYQVLLDEANVPVNDLQKLIYQHCYQYMRSTTPVSLFPAVYYAHLASKRAACHDPTPSSQGPQGGQKGEERRLDEMNARRDDSQAQISQTGSFSAQQTDAKPLLPLGNPNGQGGIEAVTKIRTAMWYI